jgi:digeranylgeranylglycerophospholipid reductase
MSFDCDVLIAGGGPAGLSAAETVASRGFSVVVAERMQSIGEQVRTSGGTLVRTMRDMEVPTDLWHGLTRIRFQAPLDAAITAFDEPEICVLNVREFFRFLAMRAVNAGAEIRTSTRVGGPIVRDHKGARCGCCIWTDGDPVQTRARVLVDATGYTATLSKLTGVHAGFRRFGIGAELEVSAHHANHDEGIILIDERFAPAGYAWVFPCGSKRIRVGVGVLRRDTRAHPQELLAALWSHLPTVGVDLRDAQVIEEHHGLIPADGMPPRIVADGVLAIGDAAGQPTLVVGEGIRLAIEAGRLAGEVISDALEKGDVSAAHLYQYERAFRRRHGRDLAIGHAVNRVVSGWDDRDRARFVTQVREMPPPVIAKLLLSQFDHQVALWLVTHPSFWRTFARAGLRSLLRR